jgi:1-acyl-sn-glycerol-3-phosphate acyltransferase
MYETGMVAAGRRPFWWQLARLTLSGIVGRLQRASRTAGELAYGFYWWLMLVAIGVPAWLAIAALPVRAWRFAVLGAAGRMFLRTVGTRLDVTFDVPLPARDTLIVANHSSYLDGLVLCAAIRGPLAFVAKEELRRQLIAGMLLKRLGAVFVRRIDPRGGIEDTDAVLTAARAGERIVTFPEGTFTRMPGLLGFRMGAFVVAAQTGIAVHPVTIHGTRSMLRGGQWMPRRGPISVRIDRPIHVTGRDFGAAARLRDMVRARMLERLGEPDLASERVELPPD